MALAVVAIGARGASAQGDDDSVVGAPVTPFVAAPVESELIVGPEVIPKLSGPARDLPPAPPPSPNEVNPLQDSGEPPILEELEGEGVVDPVAQFSAADGFALNLLGNPIVNVPGMGGSNPNDTNGDVGPNHFVQMINSRFRIFDKQGMPLGPAANINTLWTTANPPDTTSECATQNRGDPIVLYDKQADRWLLSQFAKNVSGQNSDPGFICVAISQTADPTGAYHLFQFTTVRFPDYYKIGVWPDGYYVSANFNTPNEALVGVMDRANMLNGNPAGFQQTTIPTLANNFDVLIPSTVEGETPPPVGTPNFFYRQADSDIGAIGGAFDRLELWEVLVDWGPGPSTLTGPFNIPTAGFDSDTCGYGIAPCVQQPGGPLLDAIQIGTMYRFPYRNFGDKEVLVGNFTVDATGNDGVGIRWFVLERTGGGPWGIANEGTYAPQPPGAPAFIHRWMGSANMDRFGNLALGFTASSSQNVFPSARYTGRVASDPLGLLPQPEITIQAGIAATGGNRWGDYYTMSVDPVDDCTFWYTGDATAANGSRQSRIASFRFSDCALDVAIAKSDSPDPVLAGTDLKYTITVTNNGPLDATNLVVTDTLPAGVSFVADSLPGSECNDTTEPTIVCNLGDLAAGGSTSFTITVKVDSDILFGPDGPIEIENTALVDQDQDDSDESNNSVSEVTLVNESADLIVTKICKPDGPAMAGGTAFCEIFVDNAGPSGARNVTLTDVHLSEGSFTIESFSASQGACNGPPPAGTVDCALGDIDAGERVTITVVVASDEGVDINDKATVASDTPDPDASNNMDQGSVSFLAKADLSITKSDSVDPVIAGTQLTYVVTVANAGPSTAINVVVADVVPAGVSIDSVAATGGGVCSAGVPGNALLPTTCTFDSLASGGGSVTMTIVVTVLPDTFGVLHNDASVSSDTLDNDNSNNLATEATTVQAEADLVISKSDAPDPVVAGSTLTYTVSVTNAGPSTAQDVAIVDTLPAGTSLVNASVLVGSGTCLETAPGVVTCTSDNDLAPGNTFTVVIEVLVDPSVPDGTTLTNNAVASSLTPDPVPGNNVDAEDTLVNAEADLWIDKTGNFPTGNPSGTILYFLTVYNTDGCSEDDPQVCGNGGPSDALNIVVTDLLPSTAKKLPVEFVSEQCSYDKGAHTVTCTEPVLAAGDFVTFSIQVKAKGSLGEITNTASVASDTTDPDGGNNSDALLMTVQGGTGDSGGPGGGRGRGGGPKK